MSHAATTPPEPRAPSFATSAVRVYELSLGEMLWSRRTIFMALIMAAPVIVALVSRIVQSFGVTLLRVEGVRVGGTGIFGAMVWLLFIRFTIPVLGVFYGTSLIADEVDDKTVTYLFTRPVQRGAVLMGKYLAYLVCTVLVVLPSIMVVYFLIVPFAEIGSSFRLLLMDLGIMALGLAAYGALFALVGTVLKRPLVVGLVFAFGWEQLAMLMPGYMHRFTLVFYLQGLVPHAMPGGNGVTSILQAVVSETPTISTCLIWLTVAIVASLFLGSRAIERREYVLEQ